MDLRSLGPFQVNPLGLGTMNISDNGYGAGITRAQAKDLLHQARDLGVDHLDTADVYGFGFSESVIGEAMAGSRDRMVISTKAGMMSRDHRREINGDPQHLRWCCENSLRRLRTDYIDVFYLHRWDPRFSIEHSLEALADLRHRGWIRAIGISEVSAQMLRRAHQAVGIDVVQNEYSLWSRDPESGALAVTQELGISFVAHAPLGRGWFTSTPPSDRNMRQEDSRRSIPRFQPPALAANAKQHQQLLALAESMGITLPQLALGWLLSRHPHITVIPGTRHPAHLAENLSTRSLTAQELEKIDLCFDSTATVGQRLSPQQSREITDPQETPYDTTIA